MLKKERKVIFIDRGKIVVANIKTRPPLEVKSSKEYKWKQENLIATLQQAKKEQNINNALLLLSDDISYTITISLEGKYAGSELRSKVHEAITMEIHEVLSDDLWDFKIITETDDMSEVLAFAPVVDIFTNIRNAINKAGIHIDAVEPELVAKSRHNNPLIGLALKKDISGKDEEVLNISLEGYKMTDKPAVSSIEPKKNIDEFIMKDTSGNKINLDDEGENSKKSGKKLFVVLSVILLICISIFAYVYMSSSNKTDYQNDPENISEQVDSQEVNDDNEDQKEGADIDLAIYSIQILNGSGVTGASSSVNEVLVAEGFSSADLANASNFDHSKTSVSTKEDVPDEIYQELKSVLSTEYEIEKGEILEEDSGHDVVIIVGVRSRVEEEDIQETEDSTEEE